MSAKKTTLTAREMELAGLVWQCFESEPKVNYEKFSKVGGFKNPGSAAAVWNSIKKKIKAQANGSFPDAAPKSNKRKMATDGDDNTPTKKPRTKAAAKSKLIAEEKLLSQDYAPVKLEQSLAHNDAHVKAEDDREMEYGSRALLNETVAALDAQVKEEYYSANNN